MSEETPSGIREGQRIAKVMARAGLCSRRDAEGWIAAGRVTVNGNVLESPAYNVSEADDVRVDGQRLAQRERTRLFLFHKPRGLVTTARDPEGRPTIFGALPPDLPRLVAIGRLDINTEGLLLLTNDGGLARALELPATGWLRRYRVRAHGRIDQPKLDSLSGGVTVDGVDYAGIDARLDREQGSNVWITMGLREGKNREIKKILEHLGLSVSRLIRVSFGPFELGELAEGEVAEVRTRVLRDQLGAKLAREAGTDFDAPIAERAAAFAPPEGGGGATAPRVSPGRKSPARERTGAGHDRGRNHGSPGERVPPPRSPPAPSRPERRRKHVSALRAEIAADAAGPRKRIERSATHDRKGRTIAVERISPAGEETRRGAGGQTRASRPPGRVASGKHGAQRSEAKRARAERPRRPGAPEAKQAGRERPPREEHDGLGRRRAEFKRQEAGATPDRWATRDDSSGPDAERKKRRADAPRTERPGSPPAVRGSTRDAIRRDRKFGRPRDEQRGGKAERGPGPDRSGSRRPGRGTAKPSGGGPRRPPRRH